MFNLNETRIIKTLRAGGIFFPHYSFDYIQLRKILEALYQLVLPNESNICTCDLMYFCGLHSSWAIYSCKICKSCKSLTGIWCIIWVWNSRFFLNVMIVIWLPELIRHRKHVYVLLSYPKTFRYWAQTLKTVKLYQTINA